MLRTGAMLLLTLGMLSACGHTPQERLASGALIGGAVGAVIGLASEPGYGNDYYEPDRRYERRRHDHRHYERRRHHRRHHDDGNWRRHRDYGDCCY